MKAKDYDRKVVGDCALQYFHVGEGRGLVSLSHLLLD